MNITCIICSDVFLPHSEVYTTQCGHLFHYHCLIQWFERSKTCPQCRARATDKTIYRIFFALADSDQIADDVTLLNKLDNLQFQLSQKEKDVNFLTEMYNTYKKQTTLLRAEIAEFENQVRVNNSQILALKDQIAYFEKKARESDRLAEELQQTKNQLKDMQMLHTADDVTLQNKLDNLQFQMSQKEKDVNFLTEMYNTYKKQTTLLRAEIAEVENKVGGSKSEIIFLKRRVANNEEESDRLAEKLLQTKNQLKYMQLLNTAVTGTREEVMEILKNEINVGSKRPTSRLNVSSSTKSRKLNPASYSIK